jgi:L-threonylcarbamoyladenylate synthase
MIITAQEAIDILRQGGNVGIPTETVYGLAAVYNDEKAIDAIFRLKGRPRENPLIIHVADIATVEEMGFIPQDFYKLTEAFWPGPLALAIHVQQDKVLTSVRAGLPTACFRMPDHPLALEVILGAGPIVMPSANLSGRPSPTDAKSVEEDFGQGFPVVDGGECIKGLESTILIYDEIWHLGRLGSLPVEEIGEVLGYMPSEKGGEKALCPGQRWRHYAPKAHLLLERGQSQAIIGFDERNYGESTHFFSLGSMKTPSVAASRLYTILRELDRRGIETAWIDTDFPEVGLFRTLKERIKKASLKK